MIEVRDVVKKFGVVEAVRGINFSVKSGEVFGFLGPNGAGKTTTIKMMIGLLKPTTGQIHIDGIDVVNHAKKIHQRIGVVFDAPNFYERLNVEENLYFYGGLHNIQKERVDELIERLQIDGQRKTQFKKLSKGQRQRVTIIRAILHRPQILFLDEPTTGLDPTSSEIIRDEIKLLNDQGTTIVLTTHYMEEADQLCDKLAFISQGQIVEVGEPHQLKLEYGQRKLEISFLAETGTKKTELSLDDPATPERVAQILANEQVLTVHSREATLAQVFIHLTGEEIR